MEKELLTLLKDLSPLALVLVVTYGIVRILAPLFGKALDIWRENHREDVRVHEEETKEKAASTEAIRLCTQQLLALAKQQACIEDEMKGVIALVGTIPKEVKSALQQDIDDLKAHELEVAGEIKALRQSINERLDSLGNEIKVLQSINEKVDQMHVDLPIKTATTTTELLRKDIDRLAELILSIHPQPGEHTTDQPEEAKTE